MEETEEEEEDDDDEDERRSGGKSVCTWHALRRLTSFAGVRMGDHIKREVFFEEKEEEDAP